MSTSYALPDFRDRFYDMTDDDDVRFIGLILSGSPDLNLARWRYGEGNTFLPNAPGFDLVVAVSNPGGDSTLWTDGTDVFIGDSAVVGTAGVTGTGVIGQVAYWSASGAISGDTGFTYDAATDILSVVAAVRLGAGSATAPAFAFTADTNTGLYSVSGDQLGVATGGTLRITVSTTAITSTLPLLAPAGTAGAPAVSFSGDTNTGIYSVGADSIGLSTGGTLRVTVATAGITSTIPFLAADGAVGAPSVSFASDTNTGIYSIAADTLGIAANGVLSLTVGAAAVTAALPVLLAAGSAAAPGVAFSGDTNTGLYNIGADQLGISTGGTLRVTLSTSGVTSTLPFLGQAGTAAAPAYSFSSDSNTGIFSVGADQLGLATGGVVQLTLTTSTLTSTVIGIFPASTTTAASIRLPHGAAPTSPVNGDMWTTSAGGLFVRINGVTVGPLT